MRKASGDGLLWEQIGAVPRGLLPGDPTRFALARWLGQAVSATSVSALGFVQDHGAEVWGAAEVS